MNNENLVIIEKYETFINYTYPMLQNIPRRHGVLKQKIIEIVFTQQELFYKALKSNQKSKLYEADAGLAAIRFYLRFLSNSKAKIMSKKQHQTAEMILAQVGGILNSWIKGK
ncbi:hypothetical protein CRV02_01065 [Arcobacter sp. CECT 8989]|uniref:diversity-generating retroelement protein Avd n=1 Tax=Arcobacter sp. CECT 8989 TaxID=2044509 RepID=UPI00100B024C|nr:diversity-generating retroelement protein Avd [Arcobacter sp. CECT 8989]RXK03816.1 hypothetical protein CRV02_01065 [Arcobacter sp. CECT 8989]